MVEIMIVVVIIGLLAAAALPAYRLITLRSRAASVVNDLRTFSTVFITYSLQNGRYPDDGDPQIVPPQVAGQLPGNFIQRTPIGGVYKWNFDVPRRRHHRQGRHHHPGGRLQPDHGRPRPARDRRQAD